LLGCPVGHSIGAAIHNAAFRARGLDAVYVPLLASDLKDFRKAAERFPLAGFSVTIPHKEGILRWVNRTDRSARTAGAANTVRVRRGRWEAINTDIEGIMAPLRRELRLGAREPLPAGFRAVVVGNGGAARAAVIALKELRCRDIAITGRSPAKVSRFARNLGGKPIPMEQLERERFDLLVHTTPVGMWPRAGECVLRPEQINCGVVFDLVYNPPETRLLELAWAQGCRTISGLEMFLAQAARQFEYWTGAEPPHRLMRRVALQELRRFSEESGAQQGQP
jgi:3-dehydroquinate dehydratase/shikimate dehydrogenase